MNHAKNKLVTDAANGQAPITTSRDPQNTGTHHLFAIIVHTIREADFDAAMACHSAILNSKWCGPLRDVLLGFVKEQLRLTAAKERTVFSKNHAASENADIASVYRAKILGNLGNEKEKKRLVSHIEQLLCQVRTWFTQQKNGLYQPRQIKSVLKDLNETVEKLANIGRKRKPVVLWDAYKSVNQHNKKLKLVKEIERLCTRVTRHIPERPLTAVSRLAKGNSTSSQSAKAFLKVWPVWRRGEHVPPSWSVFGPVFIYLQEEKVIGGRSSNGILDMGHPGSPELTAFCAWLTLANKDLDWVHCYHEIIFDLDRWVMSDLCSQKLAKFLQPVLNMFAIDEDEYLEMAKESEEMRRAIFKRVQNAQRKRKQRQKIRPKA